MMKFRTVLVGLCLLLLSIPTFAQDSVEWGDYGLAVELPDDWEIDDSGDSDASLVVFSGDLAIYFWEAIEGDDAEQQLEDVLDNADNDAYEFSDIDNDIEIMGEEAFRLYFESETVSGFIVSFESDGLLFLLNAVVADDSLSSGDEEDLLEVVLTIDESSGGGGGGGDGETVESAADEDASADDVIEELVDLELVSEDGDIIFEVDEVEEDTLEFVESYEGGNLVIAGWLSLEEAADDEDYRFCSFIAQSTTDDPDAEEGNLLLIGFDSTGVLLTYEFALEDEDAFVFETFDPGVDIEDTSHVMFIIQDDELTAFVNGEPVLEGWELDISAGDDERFAGFISNEGCEMTNVWAYSFE